MLPQVFSIAALGILLLNAEPSCVTVIDRDPLKCKELYEKATKKVQFPEKCEARTQQPCDKESGFQYPPVHCCTWTDKFYYESKMYQQHALPQLLSKLQYTDNRFYEETLVQSDDNGLSVWKVKEEKVETIETPPHQKAFQTNGAKKGTKQVQIDTAKMVRESKVKRKENVKAGRVDSRIPVPTGEINENNKPFERVGLLLTIGSKGKNEPCSGTIIGPYWILTAAHCITERDIIMPVSKMVFYPHFNREKEDPLTTVPKVFKNWKRIKAVYLPKGFLTNVKNHNKNVKNHDEGTTAYDIALLQTVNKMDFGHLGYIYVPYQELQHFVDNDDKFITIGYPGDHVGPNKYREATTASSHKLGKPFIMHEGLVMAKGLFQNTAEKTIIYKSDNRIRDEYYKLKSGQSGSSIFKWFPHYNEYLSIGVVSATLEDPKPDFKYTKYNKFTSLRAFQFNDIINRKQIVTDLHPVQSSAYDGYYGDDMIYNYFNYLLFDEDTYNDNFRLRRKRKIKRKRKYKY